MKKAVQALITLYQKYISPASQSHCRFYPSCSEYSKLAIESNGLFKGLFLSIYRILRCNPFSKAGVDFPPNSISKDHSHDSRHG